MRVVAVQGFCSTAVLAVLAGLLAVDASARPNAGRANSASLRFELNRGQVNRSVSFLARGESFGVFLGATRATLALATRPGSSGSISARRPQVRGVLTMRLLRASRSTRLVGAKRLRERRTYARGRASRWRSGLPTFSTVVAKGVYPGVDLRYRGVRGRLFTAFRLGPRADVGAIRWTVGGATSVRITRSGALEARLRRGAVRVLRPSAHQMVGGRRVAVRARYVWYGRRTVGLHLADRVESEPVEVEVPTDYSGPVAESGSSASDVAVDAEGNVHVAGTTWTVEYPGKGGADFERHLVAFVEKRDPRGVTLSSTGLAGGGALGLTLDRAGNAYLTGIADSPDFPTSERAVRSTPAHPAGDAFAAKLDERGELVYSTFLGGRGTDVGQDIAVDSTGSAYVTGRTWSPDFPTTAGTLKETREPLDFSPDAFAFKLAPSGSSLEYSTYLGGSFFDAGFAISVASGGEAVVTGIAGFAECFPSCPPGSVPFPTTPGAFQTQPRGVMDAFVARLDRRGRSFRYSTLIGGSGTEWATDLVLTPDGAPVVTGVTEPRFQRPSDFPTTADAFQRADASAAGSAFVTALATDGSRLTHSSHLGGSGADLGAALSAGPGGRVYVAGHTFSTDFPTTATAAKRTLEGQSSGFFAALNPQLTRLEYSTYLGDAGNEEVNGLALAGDALYAAGVTASDRSPRVGTPFTDPFGGAVGTPFLHRMPVPATAG